MLQIVRIYYLDICLSNVLVGAHHCRTMSKAPRDCTFFRSVHHNKKGLSAARKS